MMEDEYYQDGGIIISNSFDMPVIDPNPETIDRQRFTVDFAGIALVVKDKYQPEYQYVSAFQGNHTLRIPVTDDLTYEYLIAASWSENPVYNTPESFKTYILREALEYNNPIVVSDLKLEIKKERYKPVEYWGWDEVHKLR